MGTETVALSMEYSPLNNVSSSGEEVEQFSLPAVVTTQYNRPKRRRKRKEFDSLKTHDINNLTTNPCCRIRTCFLASVIVVLVSVTCGMSVMLFFMSRTVTQIQEQMDNLQLAKETASSSISALQNQLDTLGGQLAPAQLTAQNNSKQLDSIRLRVNGLESNVQTMKSQMEGMLSNSESTKGVQKEVAKAGSEILAIKSDIDSFRRESYQLDKEFKDLKTLINTTLAVSQPNAAQLSDSRQDSKDAKNGQDHIDGNLVMDVENLEGMQKAIAAQNISLETLEAKVKSLNLDCDGVCQTLVHRVDTLEIYMRQIQQEVEETFTTSFEDRVFNLTAFEGIEDIISRVINMKTSSLHQETQSALDKAERLQEQVENLWQRVNSLQVLTSATTSATTSLTTPSKPLIPLADLTTRGTTSASTVDSFSPTVDSESSHRVNMSNSDLEAMFAEP